MCVYQTAEFTLELTDEDGETLLSSSQVYNGSLPTQFFSVLLKRETDYSLEAVVTSFMQNVTKTVVFGEIANKKLVS